MLTRLFIVMFLIFPTLSYGGQRHTSYVPYGTTYNRANIYRGYDYYNSRSSRIGYSRSWGNQDTYYNRYGMSGRSWDYRYQPNYRNCK